MCNIFSVSSKYSQTLKSYSPYLKAVNKTARIDRHGWGLASCSKKESLVFKEPIDIRQSSFFPNLVDTFKTKFPIYLFHLREMSRWSKSKLENSHPFILTLPKQKWVFMHNGEIQQKNHRKILSSTFKPYGDTDSEKVFCALAEIVKNKYTYESLWNFLKSTAKLGVLNVMFSNGEELFVFRGGKRNSLFFLEKKSQVLFSKYKLSRENWKEFKVPELLIAKKGKIIKHFQ